MQESRRWADVPGGDGSLRGPELRQIRAEALQFPSGAIHGDWGRNQLLTNQSRESGGGHLSVEHYTSVVTGTQLPATPIELESDTRLLAFMFFCKFHIHTCSRNVNFPLLYFFMIF